jgi:hypothetical protein
VAELAPVAESIREIEACNVALATKTVANVIAIAKYLGGTRSHLPTANGDPGLRASSSGPRARALDIGRSTS